MTALRTVAAWFVIGCGVLGFVYGAKRLDADDLAGEVRMLIGLLIGVVGVGLGHLILAIEASRDQVTKPESK